ncbi:MAG TPA: VUT family protein [Archaeoglobus profundus]|nr:VUT family protein [Archaeoglobus profundus]HIP58200.1 VUT family protein [Archaeoglobus profundus]
MEFIIWTIITLSIVTFTAIIAEKYGIEILIGVFATLTVVANIVSSKLVAIGPLIGPAGVIVYSATFLVTDFISERYGKDYAKRAVLSGFIANIVALSAIISAVLWTPAEISVEMQEVFEKIFTMTPRIIIASMIAYLISQIHDVYAFHYWKNKTRGRYLWIRNNASTMVSQAIDTVIFITIAFYGVVPLEVLLNMIVSQYIVKVAIALMDTPFIYAATSFTKVFSEQKDFVQQ